MLNRFSTTTTCKRAIRLMCVWMLRTVDLAVHTTHTEVQPASSFTRGNAANGNHPFPRKPSVLLHAERSMQAENMQTNVHAGCSWLRLRLTCRAYLQPACCVLHAVGQMVFGEKYGLHYLFH